MVCPSLDVTLTALVAGAYRDRTAHVQAEVACENQASRELTTAALTAAGAVLLLLSEKARGLGMPIYLLYLAIYIFRVRVTQQIERARWHGGQATRVLMVGLHAENYRRVLRHTLDDASSELVLLLDSITQK